MVVSFNRHRIIKPAGNSPYDVLNHVILKVTNRRIDPGGNCQHIVHSVDESEGWYLYFMKSSLIFQYEG